VPRQLRGRATAVGVARQEPPGADRAGAAAGRGGELPGAAGDFPGLLHRHPKQAAVWAEGERGVHRGADQVHGALGEDQVVPADVVRVGGQARDLDDPAGAAEHPLGDDHAGDHRAGARHARGHDGAAERLAAAGRRCAAKRQR